jgi:hypothetical protein
MSPPRPSKRLHVASTLSSTACEVHKSPCCAADTPSCRPVSTSHISCGTERQLVLLLLLAAWSVSLLCTDLLTRLLLLLLLLEPFAAFAWLSEGGTHRHIVSHMS